MKARIVMTVVAEIELTKSATPQHIGRPQLPEAILQREIEGYSKNPFDLLYMEECSITVDGKVLDE